MVKKSNDIMKAIHLPSVEDEGFLAKIYTSNGAEFVEGS